MGRTHRTAVSVAATALRSRLTPVAQRIRISPENLLLPASVRTMATLPDKHGSYDLLAKGKLDMSRMAAIIERQRLRLLENVETDGAEVMANTVIADALFGKDDGSELQPALDDIQLYAAVATWSADQWIDLHLKWHVNASCIAVIGEPSAKLVDDLKAQEAARIADTKTRLG